MRLQVRKEKGVRCPLSRRPFAGTVICFALGVAWGLFQTWYFPAACLFLILFFLAAGWRRKYKCGWEHERQHLNRYLLVWFVLELAAFFLGSVHALGQSQSREAYLPYLKDGAEASLQGVICRKEEKNETYLVYLKDVIVQIDHQRYRTNQVLVHLSADQYPIGTTLLVNGTIQRFRHAANEGGYNEEQYYHARKIDYGMWANEIKGCYGNKNTLSEGLYRFRKKLKESLKKNTKEESAGLLAVMTLGEKSMLDADVKEQYKQAGISHILVISGLHISLIGMGVFRLLRKWIRVEAAAVLSIGLLLCYGCMTGSGTSTMRAIIMFVLCMGGKCFGRAYDAATGLAAAVLLLLLQNPFLLSDAGFLFSAAAVLGVVFSETDAKSWQISLNIQLVTIPLAAYYYYEIPVYSLAVNLLVLPLVAPITVLGFCGSALGLFLKSSARLVLFLPHVCLQLIGTIAKLTVHLPLSQAVVGCPKIWRICVYYLLLCAFFKMRAQRKRVLPQKEKKNERVDKRSLAVQCAKSLILLSCMWWTICTHPTRATKIDVLDVGQGDGICIQTREGATLFIDGGSSDTDQVGTYRIEPYLKYNAIDRVDYWFVSHSDSDHISGLMELIGRGYKIGHLVVSACETDNENRAALLKAAAEKGIAIHEMKAGDLLRLKSANMRCVFPYSGYNAKDQNAASLVLLYEEGDFSGLFTGDTGSPQEQELLRKITREGPALSDIDFYKAAHHGSRYSNSKEWLLYLRPKASVISCGAGNRYGHPSKEAVANMQNAGSDVFDTMEGGQVSLILKQDGMRVRNYQHTVEEKRYLMVE